MPYRLLSLPCLPDQDQDSAAVYEREYGQIEQVDKSKSPQGNHQEQQERPSQSQAFPDRQTIQSAPQKRDQQGCEQEHEWDIRHVAVEIRPSLCKEREFIDCLCVSPRNAVMDHPTAIP